MMDSFVQVITEPILFSHHYFLIVAAISMIRISEQNLGQENSIVMTHSISV